MKLNTSFSYVSRLTLINLDKSDLKNFRPITDLSTISKILEQLALNRLKRCTVESPNFGQLQSVYLQGHS
jgi:hypothetical protein